MSMGSRSSTKDEEGMVIHILNYHSNSFIRTVKPQHFEKVYLYIHCGGQITIC